MSIINKKKVECCGCNACAEICPKHCIKMLTDTKGFLYPQVDSSVCVECGACENVCPFYRKNISLYFPFTAYAAWNKNKEEYLASSSGGAAYVFSDYIIRHGGVVYGCAADGMDVRHVRVDNIKQLPRLQGSKYVQSDVRGLFAQVASDLKSKRPVLFIGTPCQVAGLKGYIRRIPSHLYLVDLIFHGVPSLKMLRSHAAFVTHGQQVTHLSFRRGNEYIMEFCGQNFHYERSPFYKDAYFRSFIKGFTCRSSCYHCPFATSNRVGDVTIGDFWGLHATGEEFSEANNGISVLLPCTEKGHELIRVVSDNLMLCERSVDEAVTGNTQLQHSMHRTMRSRVFNLIWPLFPFDVAAWLSLADQLLISLKRRGLKYLLNGLRK